MGFCLYVCAIPGAQVSVPSIDNEPVWEGREVRGYGNTDKRSTCTYLFHSSRLPLNSLSRLRSVCMLPVWGSPNPRHSSTRRSFLRVPKLKEEVVRDENEVLKKNDRKHSHFDIFRLKLAIHKPAMERKRAGRGIHIHPSCVASVCRRRLRHPSPTRRDQKYED